MHESSYSPPLPLNLSISERAQSFLKDLNGWSLALTGHHPHCWSLHFSPSSNCYRWLYISLTHYLLCSNRQYLCWLLLFGGIYIKSCRFFFNHPIHNSFISPTSHLFLHCSHAEVQNISRMLSDKQTPPSGFPSKSTCLVFLSCLLLFAGG